MASISREESPPPRADSTTPSISSKRKRDDSLDIHSHANGVQESKSEEAAQDPQSLIQDLLDVLKIHDTKPSILRRPLAERAPLTEPQPKRQKADSRGDAPTIATRVSTNTYTTLDEVLRDIDSAVSSTIADLDLPDDAVQRRHVPIAPEKLELCTEILAFKSRAHDLVRKHYASEGKITNTSASAREASVVLSLYGNTAAGPKQLFSSRQLRHSAQGEAYDNLLSVRDVALPSGMFTTDISPTDPNTAMELKRGRTMGEVFPSPSSLPTLEPPRLSKVATTRDATVGWYDPSTAAREPRAEDYYNQPIATGQWLDYGNASPSHGSKKKQRGRTMSLIGSKPPQLDPESTEPEAAKLDSLFRSAYSTFAPSRDDSAALVTVGFMNRVWWEHNGQKSFERLVENGDNVSAVFADEPAKNGPAPGDDDEDEKFREAVEAYEQDAIDPSLEPAPEKSALEKDTDEVLEGISELLQTLSSYQRIRNLSLNSSKGPASTSDTATNGTPSTPGEGEFNTYEILKSQLALMVGSLPPFAVAKLDADQLAELGVSTKVPVLVEEVNGNMDEEEVAARLRLAALGTSSAASRVGHPAAVSRHSTSALYGNQYSAPRSAGPVSQQYYGSQTPMRTSSASLQRPPATAPTHYPMQRPTGGSSYRPGSYGTPSYPHQAARSLSQQYNPSPPQYIQTPGGHPYARAPSQPYQGSVPQPGSHTSMNTRYASQSGYSQQTPTQNGLGYPYGNGVSANRQSSPQKGPYNTQQVTEQLNGPGSYSSPTPPASQGSRSYMQNHMSRSPAPNGASQSPQPQHTPQPLGLTTPYSTFMTTAEQASMMERQRAQLAQQQGLQQQARNAAQAGTMGSPPKTQVNGSALAAGL